MVKVLAFYLPQYHPIPENDTWWGMGFTEWTNTAKAIPLFPGHYQPHLPGNLGYYDLRKPDDRQAQAALAKEYGLGGFVYWHYWFGNGKQLLERPFKEVLESGQPDFPFCLAWANQSWTGVWHGLDKKILIEQTYPGKEDYIAHFNHVLPAFRDPRYLRIENKPVFVVFSPELLPDAKTYTSLWNELALQNGLDGIWFIGIHFQKWDFRADGFNGTTFHQPSHYLSDYRKAHPWRSGINALKELVFKPSPKRMDLEKLVNTYQFDRFKEEDVMPAIIPNWDNTPRSGGRGWVFENTTPELFKKHLGSAVESVRNKPEDKQIVFIKSWNEWAEGNYLEPDQRWGMGFLEALKEVTAGSKANHKS
jgi:hypothetical protein